jgi:hypothetical protein
MAKIRLDWHGAAGLRAIDCSPEALALVEAKVEAIAKACNEESSWGGYASAASIDDDRVRGRVWSYDNRVDEARDQRMIKNLDA